MFDLESEIKQWRAELGRAGICDKEVVDELEVHLRQHFSDVAGSGLPETEAFQGAKNRLGKGEVLNREFSKVKQYRSRNWRNNPLALNLAGGWVVLMGLYWLSAIAVLAGIIGPQVSIYVDFSYARMSLFASLQILAGLGMLRRNKFWRYVALAFLSYDCLLAGWVLIHVVLNYSDLILNLSRLHPPDAFFTFLGIPVSLRFMLVSKLLDLGLSLFGLCTLMRPAVRELFRPAVADSAVTA